MTFWCRPNDRYADGYRDGYVAALKEALYRIGIFHPGLADSVIAQDIQKMISMSMDERHSA